MEIKESVQPRRDLSLGLQRIEAMAYWAVENARMRRLRETMNGLLQAKIFKRFTGWNAIVYQGWLTPKVLQFEITEGGETRPLYLATVVSREEKSAWQSFQDLLDHAARLAQPGMQGFFGLDVLVPAIHNGIEQFNIQDFSRLLINYSRELGPAPGVLIRYGQLFSVLQKRAAADWGKIEVKTHVEIIDPEKVRFENFQKKLIAAGHHGARAVYFIHDVSAVPVWKTEEVSQPSGEPDFFYAAASVDGFWKVGSAVPKKGHSCEALMSDG